MFLYNTVSGQLALLLLINDDDDDDFQAPVLFSSTFKALNLGEKNSSTFKDAWEPCFFDWVCLFITALPHNTVSNQLFQHIVGLEYMVDQNGPTRLCDDIIRRFIGLQV